MFLAPSKFLLERYVDWGIPRDRIRFEDYGRIRERHVVPDRPRREGKRNRFAFFGQFNYYKGVNVLLKAMAMLGERGIDAHCGCTAPTSRCSRRSSRRSSRRCWTSKDQGAE